MAARMMLTDDPLTDPIVLDPCCFTILARTPWASDVIAQRYKAAFVDANTRVGESWEFSCDPSLPSKIMGTDIGLHDLIATRPAEILSETWAHQGRTCHLLIKLLSAAAPLSLQVHPSDDDPNLGPGECGKPESWLILEREEGAGIYLGFSKKLSKGELALALRDGDAAQDLLQFVPVEKGDFFEITPGVPHAIGAGVTLLEPQRILPGMSGKTYRLWDWNRKYDPSGQLDPINGKPRELHTQESLAIIQPEFQWGRDFVSSCKRTPSRIDTSWGGEILTYPANAYYQVRILKFPAGHPPVGLDSSEGFGALVTLGGHYTAVGHESRLGKTLKGGMSALVPHKAFPISLCNFEQRSHLAVVTPGDLRILL